jgi:2-dehydro-3-deoxygalactonokinase
MTGVLPHTALIGIDWGLTQLRAYCIGEEGNILQERQCSAGILAVKDKNFAARLHSLIADWLTAQPDVPVFLCGMIGSRNGWYEVPYSRCPASLHEIAENAIPIDIGSQQAHLIGGLSFTDEKGQYDVIRGEETQILGVIAKQGSQLIVTPGTHSKWAMVRDGTVEYFRTYMTGELYAVLSKHSSLGWWTKEAKESADDDEESFRDGVRASLEDPDLLHSLFTVRTRGLFSGRPACAHAAYLSGILIGNEIASGLNRHSGQAPTLIGSSSLARLYQIAMSAAGVRKIECIAGDQAVARGLWRLSQWRAAR